ncbi:MAG: 3-phosphoshikimate 1-carboxyvinyltransferase [SAR324 cluster bacterium]|nr:3-phosphoshikimate 1-carboxyvinyltransferase [SAR324 cluster bacterium]
MLLDAPLTLPHLSGIGGHVRLPGSKSMSNRALLLSALARGETIVENILDSDDVRYMVQALETLGLQLTNNWDQHWIKIQGCAGIWPVKGTELFLGNAGTAIRPLTVAVALGDGRFVLDGVPRMRERPIQDLLDAMNTLGMQVRSIHETGCPPVEVIASGIPGGITELSGAISSQFLTALLMVAPYAEKDVTIHIKDKLVSVPYVVMTLEMMKHFGVKVEHKNFEQFYIQHGQVYQSPGHFYVEGDASSASYFLAGAAITGKTVTVEGCGKMSLQGDVHFADVLAQMGATVEWTPHSVTVTGNGLQGVDIDMNTMPDAAMTLAVAALFANGPTRIRNIYNWRLKETERLHAVSTELRKLGADIEEGVDYLVIEPPPQIKSTSIETYDDHRMAMAFSLAACGEGQITINQPDCVSKTFPDYFDVLLSLQC